MEYFNIHEGTKCIVWLTCMRASDLGLTCMRASDLSCEYFKMHGGGHQIYCVSTLKCMRVPNLSCVYFSMHEGTKNILCEYFNMHEGTNFIVWALYHASGQQIWNRRARALYVRTVATDSQWRCVWPSYLSVASLFVRQWFSILVCTGLFVSVKNRWSSSPAG